MSVIPYLSQGQGVSVDPLTGLPRAGRKKQPWEIALGARSTGLNQRYRLGAFDAFAPTGGGGSSGGGGGSGGQPYTIPGHTPDYKSLIEAALGPLQAQLDAEGVQDLNARNSQLVRALGQFGQQFDTAGARQAFGNDFFQQAGLEDLLPQANQLARQTTDAGVSFMARAGREHQQQVQRIQDALAARGLHKSGALGIALQDQQRQFDTGQYDARLQVQDFLSSVVQGYVQEQRRRAAVLDAARREEAPRQAALNPATGSVTVGIDDPRHPQYVNPNPPAEPPAAPGVPTPPNNNPPPPMSTRPAGEDWQDILARVLRVSQANQAV